jgi:hypothetical protein
VRTQVEEGAKCTVGTAHNENGRPCRVEEQPVAGLGQIAREARQQGFAAEDSLTLRIEAERVCIDPRIDARDRVTEIR